jgi:hypothetical protein
MNDSDLVTKRLDDMTVTVNRVKKTLQPCQPPARRPLSAKMSAKPEGTGAAPKDDSALPGALSAYQLNAKLGRGGSGVVYKAIHRLKGHIVAVKRVSVLNMYAALPSLPPGSMHPAAAKQPQATLRARCAALPAGPKMRSVGSRWRYGLCRC